MGGFRLSCISKVLYAIAESMIVSGAHAKERGKVASVF